MIREGAPHAVPSLGAPAGLGRHDWTSQPWHPSLTLGKGR
jgi:hypothetical protein